MPYIYATALPGDIVKLGRGTHKSRALAAQTYYADRVQVLACWRTDHPQRDERRAQQACVPWHVRGELYRVPTGWLDTEHPLVALLRGLLGDPLPARETPQWRPHGGMRIGEWTESGVKRPPSPSGRPATVALTANVGRPLKRCKHGHLSIWRSGNCMECVKMSNARFKARHGRK